MKCFQDKLYLSALDHSFRIFEELLTIFFMNTRSLIVRRAPHMLEYCEKKMFRGKNLLYSFMFRKFMSEYSILYSAHLPLR